MNLTIPIALDKGKYLLDTQLGKGVFALTYRATNTESGQTVVIKTIGETLRQYPDFDQFKRRFLELGDRLKSCSHPNLVKVLDSFEEAGHPYLVMEYIAGQSLAELMQFNVLSEAKAVRYIRQVGNAITALAQVGLRHQDIKPDNIIWHQERDSVVLCDAITCEFTLRMLQTHAILSTEHAPQQCYGFESQQTPAADIYSLAATLYYLLTGHPPLPPPVREVLPDNGGISVETLQKQHLFPPNLQQRQYNLSPAIKQAIYCGLQLAAERCPQTVEDWFSLLPSQKKIPVREPLTQYLVAQPKAQTSEQVKSNPTNTTNKMPQLPIKEKKMTPQLEVVQSLVNSHKTAKTRTSTQRNQLQLPNTSVENTNEPCGTAKVGTSAKKSRYLLLRSLLMTGAIAASAGVGFGFALRINGSNVPGSTILHTKQSFPPRPMSEPSPQPKF